MRRILLAIVLLLAPCSIFNVQCSMVMAQSLVGRVYYNANILSDRVNDVINKSIPEAKTKKIAEMENKKGRKLTDAEKAEVEKNLQEAQAKAYSAVKGIKTAITVEFRSETQAVMKMDMQVDEDALKQAGVNWAKRKALKAAIALAPSTEKAEYVVQGNLVIMDPSDEPDTLRLSDDGKYLMGTFDKKTNYKLTRTK